MPHLNLTKQNFQDLNYLLTCFKRNKMSFDTGHGPIDDYISALHKVMLIPSAYDFTIEAPDGSPMSYRDVTTDLIEMSGSSPD